MDVWDIFLAQQRAARGRVRARLRPPIRGAEQPNVALRDVALPWWRDMTSSLLFTVVG